MVSGPPSFSREKIVLFCETNCRFKIDWVPFIFPLLDEHLNVLYSSSSVRTNLALGD